MAAVFGEAPQDSGVPAALAFFRTSCKAAYLPGMKERLHEPPINCKGEYICIAPYHTWTSLKAANEQ